MCVALLAIAARVSVATRSLHTRVCVLGRCHRCRNNDRSCATTWRDPLTTELSSSKDFLLWVESSMVDHMPAGAIRAACCLSMYMSLTRRPSHPRTRRFTAAMSISSLKTLKHEVCSILTRDIGELSVTKLSTTSHPEGFATFDQAIRVFGRGRPHRSKI